MLLVLTVKVIGSRDLRAPIERVLACCARERPFSPSISAHSLSSLFAPSPPPGRTVDETACNRFAMSSLFTGGFVGAFYLRDIVDLDVERWEVWRSTHLDDGPYQSNSFGWVIGQVVRLQRPVVASGTRGLYRVEASTSKQLLKERFFGET
jgi:hypothetical protein